MLKKLLVLFILSYPCMGQTIVSEDELSAQDQGWMKDYQAGPVQLGKELAASFQEILDAAFPRYSANSQRVMLRVFVGDKGKIDYLVYEVHGDDIKKEVLVRIMQHELGPAFSSWQMTGVDRKYLFNFFFGTKGVRQPTRLRPKSDSTTLTTLEELRAYPLPEKITTINLGGLDLRQVPEEIYRFPNLKVLSLEANQLTSARFRLDKFPRLETLMLHSNPLTQLKLKGKSRLKRINLQTVKLKHSPAALKKLRQLESVWLGFNPQLDLRKKDFRRLRRIEDLNLYACKLKSLSPHIRLAKNLQVLDLYYNELEALPAAITRLSRLTHLAAANNRLEKLPENMGNLKKLQYLYLHHNRLSKLPESIGALDSLGVLDIGYNWFYSYPLPVNHLKNLKELDLSGNKLPAFPPALTELMNLDRIFLRGNPFLQKERDVQFNRQIETVEQRNGEIFY
ncbi:hypothetical protein GCM10023091_18240 [Ravibacter arvi]|uniref:Disease resistance R13L4/SHOC-2-like LRR domain-containing protein n=1 Tax=Ravibacter arvi TaxID=2051041 RepID=A0ABP8LYS6_9BACT